MLTHAGHLLWRSLSGVPGALGSTWLGVLFPVVVALLGETIGISVYGWKEVKANWKKATGIAFTALGVGYSLLFVFLVVQNIYQDHMRLVSSNQQLRQQLSGTSHEMSLQITGLVLSEVRDEVRGESTRLQATVIAYNQGDPVTAHNWGMQIKTPTSIIPAVHLFSEDIMNGSPKLPFIDEVLQRPIDAGQETAGLITFLFPRTREVAILRLTEDESSKAVVVITADTSSGKQVMGMESLHELYEHGKGMVHSGNRK